MIKAIRHQRRSGVNGKRSKVGAVAPGLFGGEITMPSDVLPPAETAHWAQALKVLKDKCPKGIEVKNIQIITQPGTTSGQVDIMWCTTYVVMDADAFPPTDDSSFDKALQEFKNNAPSESNVHKLSIVTTMDNPSSYQMTWNVIYEKAKEDST